jgi:hypothetical protein
MFFVWLALFVVVVLGGYGWLMRYASKKETLFDGEWDSTQFHDWKGRKF